MAGLQKTVMAAALAAAVTTAIYQAHQAAKTRADLEALRQEQAAQLELIQQLQREREEATKQLARLSAKLAADEEHAELLKLRGEVARLRAATPEAGNTPLASEASSWIERANQLRKYLERNPDKEIPELQFLTPGDWLNAGRESGLEDEIALRKALRGLRDTAKARVSPLIWDALVLFGKANAGAFPADMNQLKAYFNPPLDEAVLARYAVVPASEIRNSRDYFPGAERLVVEKAPVDVEFDTRVVVGPNGRRTSDFDGDMLLTVTQAFEAANPGIQLGEPSQLLPYVKTLEQQQALQRSIQRMNARRR